MESRPSKEDEACDERVLKIRLTSSEKGGIIGEGFGEEKEAGPGLLGTPMSDK